jgi:two-component system response regulator AtoC
MKSAKNRNILPLKEITELHRRIAHLEKENTDLKKELKDRRKQEKILRDSEKMYRTLVNISSDLVAVHDLDDKAKVIDCSPRTFEVIGFKSADELIGKYGLDYIAPEDRDKALLIRKKIFEEGFVKNMEITMMKTDGTRFIGEFNATLIRDAKGNPKYLIGSTKDITERKKMQEKLKQYSEKLEHMVKERTRELTATKKEVRYLREQIQQSQKYSKIIGNSSTIHHVIDLIHQVARTNSTVLIYGETGSGKDLIARAIHFNSSQKDGPFITVNCAALPEHLIESELFGYVKGAFTGATHNKIGLFEEAHTGTIFLNEVGDIPLRLQGKLLEVLETGQMRRVGQSKSITIDVRIIAASNTNLEEAVKQGNFRQDLYYRLKVLLINLPPLRERKEDIPLLVKFFFDKYCSIMNREIIEISQETMELLCKYSYPGNVRELENIIQHAIVMSQSNMLIPQNLPDEIRGIRPDTQARNLSDSLAKIEKQKIKTTLAECNGNLSKAAKLLGINRTTLWRRIKKYDINIS